jgi:TonB family protein
MSPKNLLLLVLIILIAGLGFWLWPRSGPEAPTPAPAGETGVPAAVPAPPAPPPAPPPEASPSAPPPEASPSAPSLDHPVSWEAVDQLPRLGFRVRPDYPEDLRGEALAAEVRLRLTVDTDGTVARAEVLESPHPAFDEPALAAARQFLFEPATRDGTPVSFAIETTVAFDPLR